MLTSAAGSSGQRQAATVADSAAALPRSPSSWGHGPATTGEWRGAARPRRGTRGFTLLELLVVVAIIAIASAGVGFALRDSGATQLEREAQRLAALFESARALSRSSGIPVRWYAIDGGFRFEGIPPASLPDRWLENTTEVRGNATLQLGPEPIIGRQEVVLGSSAFPGRSLRVATDGLRPFAVSAEATP